jgi:putative inorganic carbon (HCO3(-)) transporter
MLPITFLVTIQPDVTRLQAFRLLAGVALYYAISNWGHSSSRLKILLFGTILAGLILSISAPFTVDWSIGKLAFIPSELYRDFSLLVADGIHPHVLAGILILLLPLPLALILFNWAGFGWLERVFYTITTAVFTATIILTQSRGAWLALGAILALIAMMRWRWAWALIVLLIGTALLVITSIGLPTTLDYLMASNTITGLAGRIEIWGRGIFIVQDFPITGPGMGTFTEVTKTLYPFILESIENPYHAHNLPLQIAVDLGIPGLIAWSAILITIIATSWLVYRHGNTNDDPLTAGIGAGLLCSQAALIIHGWTDVVPWVIVRPAPVLWVIWGLTVVAWHTLVNQDQKYSP